MTDPRHCANTGENVWEWMGANGVPIVRMTNKLSVRRRLTLEEAERGDLPKPFSAEEWRAMAQASKQIT